MGVSREINRILAFSQLFGKYMAYIFSLGSILIMDDESNSAETAPFSMVAFSEKRHTESIEGINTINHTWRMKERMKTVSVALVLCLNVGVDPPDIVKTQPCARLECWIDPLSMSAQKALESIGASLQSQYERWQPRARYKQSLDPTMEEVKKLCTSLRRNAKEERVLLHYNGHGVPRPTANGEIWVFNRTYTQYIPLSVYDLQAWMGSPSIYVYDCSNAGMIVKTFNNFAEQHEKEYEMSNRGTGVPPAIFKNCIQLAACAENQILPMNAELPADLFTACLTTPIKIALKWYVMQNTQSLMPNVTLDLIEKVPGQLSDRRTMLGELNWIFTAITDTIAWNTLPRELFQKLFRQDLLVASLFRNFLLAERIMRSYDCVPVSSPSLPPTYQHPMWQAWDLALDLCLGQLPDILNNDTPFEHSNFFEEQLTAFEVWLALGSEDRSPPEQLPVVLQVLLSQVHRVRALDLLGKFLDLGPWAVNLALSVGIFPYVLKLLQSSAKELRPLLVFIWAKILAVDRTCQSDLVRDSGHKYFLSVLQDYTMSSENRTTAAFILACMVQDYPAGQEVALQGSLVSICLEQLENSHARLRQWLALALGRLWERHEAARWCGVRDSAHEKLYQLLKDPVPEVRAAAVYALGTFIASVSERSEHANKIDHNVAMTLITTVGQDMSPLVRKEMLNALQWLVLIFEASFCSAFLNSPIDDNKSLREGALSPLPAQAESSLLSPLSGMRRIASRDRLKILSPGHFFGTEAPVSGITLSDNVPTDKIKRVSSTSSLNSIASSSSALASASATTSVYVKQLQAFQVMEHDPHPEVAAMAKKVVDYIKIQARENTASIREVYSISPAASPSGKVSFMVSESPPTSNDSSMARFNARGALRRKPIPGTINEEGTKEITNGMRCLVTTQFLEWSSRYFAQPSINNKRERKLPVLDCDFEFRIMRNQEVEQEADEERSKVMSSKLEALLFQGRNSGGLKCAALHAYEPLMTVTGNDYFSLWDWQSGAKLSYSSNKNARGAKISCIALLNEAEALPLLLVGSDDGTIKIWKNSYNNKEEAALITAWQGLTDPISSLQTNTQHPKTHSGSFGLVAGWIQKHKRLAVTGDLASRHVRLWDVTTEKKIYDLPIGTDSSAVCCLGPDYSGESLLAAGCGDGSVRLFDWRLSPHEARVMTWREHTNCVIGLSLRKATSMGGLVSGCKAGDVKLFDLRRHSAIASIHLNQGIGKMAVHQNADIFCYGSISQYIGVYPIPGTTKLVNSDIGSIRYQEGFRGQRLGPATCLTFHPLRVLLAAGSADNSIRVYGQDNARR
ncbi:Hypothetical predicted protein [Cloeon dipterum]|uniref:Raptor N-terminal CASPase-like domain-containing protein n=1 Tax=Cloeon dipterum TaxID=197152 RepID=A0A8S1CDD8_9INSE|nr:Hypothetical predicted protein [Cloeon dipterum]